MGALAKALPAAGTQSHPLQAHAVSDSRRCTGGVQPRACALDARARQGDVHEPASACRRPHRCVRLQPPPPCRATPSPPATASRAGRSLEGTHTHTSPHTVARARARSHPRDRRHAAACWMRGSLSAWRRRVAARAANRGGKAESSRSRSLAATPVMPPHTHTPPTAIPTASLPPCLESPALPQHGGQRETAAAAQTVGSSRAADWVHRGFLLRCRFAAVLFESQPFELWDLRKAVSPHRSPLPPLTLPSHPPRPSPAALPASSACHGALRPPRLRGRTVAPTGLCQAAPPHRYH